jgi:hypothetical protein
MGLQPKRIDFTVQREYLDTTQGQVFKTAGLTLDASAFTGDQLTSEGYVLAGSGVRLDSGTGLAVPHDNGTTAGTLYVLVNDVKLSDGDALAGAYEEAYLNRAVVTATEPGRIALSDAFVTASGNRFKLR